MFLRSHMLELARTLEQRAREGRVVRLLPSTGAVLAAILREVAQGDGDNALSISVEVWSADGDRMEEVIARTSSSQIAMASYAEALRARPDHRVIVRQRSHVLADSGSGPSPNAPKPVPVIRLADHRGE